jgi:hypothetical protein
LVNAREHAHDGRIFAVPGMKIRAHHGHRDAPHASGNHEWDYSSGELVLAKGTSAQNTSE